MTPWQVVTWNVLHRIHAVNWAEPCIAKFPDEALRLEQIAARVAGFFEAGATAVCLQEVSGDQLALLRTLAALQVFEHTYLRIPKLRKPGASLRDPTEHLVTLVRPGGARQVAARTYPTDPGKGLLAVDLGGALLVNTHVTFAEKGRAQLALLAEVAAGDAVVVGDFNAPAPLVTAALGVAFTRADTGQAPTRVATPQYPDGKTIDHVLVRGGRVEAAEVLDGGGLSDHSPVRVTASWGRG